MTQGICHGVLAELALSLIREHSTDGGITRTKDPDRTGTSRHALVFLDSFQVILAAHLKLGHGVGVASQGDLQGGQQWTPGIPPLLIL